MPDFMVQDIKLVYDVYGSGPSLFLLHAGWGAAVNGFDYQQKDLADSFQLVIPHRRGYGPSSRIQSLPADYHYQAANDMLAVMDHAGVQETHLWGHSDGAVVGAWMAILAPERIQSLVFEGGHLLANKDGKRGRAFMERIRNRPDSLPESMKQTLAQYHGTVYWKRIMWMWTEAWRLLSERDGDLYNGRLNEIQCPTLVIHGGRDPHTTLDEVGQLADQIPNATTLFIPEGGHSLHDDPAMVAQVHQTVLNMLTSLNTD